MTLGSVDMSDVHEEEGKERKIDIKPKDQRGREREIRKQTGRVSVMLSVRHRCEL